MIFNDLYRSLSFEEVKDRVPPEVATRLDPHKSYGIWWYNRRRFEPKRTPPKTRGDFKRKYKPIEKPRDEWIGIPVPDPGISAELADAARTRMVRNKAPSKNGRRYWELSGGIVRCAECGYVMGTTSSGTPTNDYFYYRCRSRYNVKSGCTNGRGVRADALEREAWERVSSALRHPDRLRTGLEKMIESRKESLMTMPDGQIARWAAEVQKAKAKRAPYQDQEAEDLMTREELRTKLTKLDETVGLAEAEIDKLKGHEKAIRELQKSGEELLEHYTKLVPEELEDLSAAERRHVHQLLQIEVWVPYEGEIRIRLPFVPDRSGFCSEKLAS